MKIVREHLNEIKRGGEGWSAIGVGHNEVIRKLKEFYSNHINYSHLLHHNIHGERIAKMLNLPIEDIMQCNVELELIETILYFDGRTDFKSMYGKEYWIWENPNFVIERDNKKNLTMLYTNKNLNE